MKSLMPMKMCEMLMQYTCDESMVVSDALEEKYKLFFVLLIKRHYFLN
jgi:hypothetical protein